jgi:enediyne biosynthesis protein E4
MEGTLFITIMGNGRFTDVTAKTHVDGTDFGTLFHTGAVFFDYDRDGWLDFC